MMATETNDQEQDYKSPPWWRCMRNFIAVLACLCLCSAYSQRINLSMAMVCMVNNTALHQHHQGPDHLGVKGHNSSSLQASVSNMSLQDQDSLEYSLQRNNGNDSYDNGGCSSSLNTLSREDGDLAWDKETQGILLGALFWGYAILQLPAHQILGMFGPKKIALIPMLIMSTMTLIGPVTARVNQWLFLVTRFIVGLSTAIVFPAIYKIWEKWTPINERTFALGLVSSGFFLGNIIVFPTSAFLCLHGFAGGWPSVFYVYAIAGYVWCAAWFIFFTDSPENHRWIGEQEKVYIRNSIGPSQNKTLISVPWKKLLTSVPVWAVVMAQLGMSWSIFLFMSCLPLYLKDVLKLDVQSNGIYTMMPQIACVIVLNTWGPFANFLIKRKVMKTVSVRRLSTVIGDFIPAILYIIISFLDCNNKITVIVLITIAIGTCTTNYMGFFCNPYDIAPPYATAIISLSNTISVLSGIISPYLATVLTKDGNPEQWRAIFYLTASICIVGMLSFLIFGKGEEMAWVTEMRQKGEKKGEKEEMLRMEEEPDGSSKIDQNNHSNGDGIDSDKSLKV